MSDKQVSCEDVLRALRDKSHNEWTAAAREHLAQCERCVESAIENALERTPETHIPPEFARQTAELVSSPSATIAEAENLPSYGWMMAVASLLILSSGLGGLLVAHPSPYGNGPFLVAAWVGIIELGGLALWVGRPSFD